MRAPTSDEVKAEVRAICKSEGFARSKRSRQLLRYVVKETLRHPSREPQIKGVLIGIEVFGKRPDFDPKKDTTVKVAMGELRDKLDQYNKGEGRNDRVRIEIFPGSYVPQFTLNLPFPPLEMDAQGIHYVSLMRQMMDERHGGGELIPQILAGDLKERYPDHPQLLALDAMIMAVNATYDALIMLSGDPLRKAEALISKVRERGIEPWECTVTDAWIKAALHWDWQKADLLFQRAIAANPEAKTIHQWYPLFLASQLKVEEGEAALQEAISHEAYDRPVTRADLAFFQILSGKLDDAERTLKGAMPLIQRMANSADFPIGYGQAALLAAVRGDFAGATSHLLNGQTDQNPVFLGLVSLFAGALGAPDVAKEGYEKMRSGPFYRASFPLAFAALGMGDEDLAVQWLTNAAVEDHDPWTLLLAVHPLLRPLHHHQEFQSLITKKMGLPFAPKS